MSAAWFEQARHRLRSLQRDSGAWGYGAESIAAVEPTVLAALALRDSDPVAARAAALWLLGQQTRRGSVPAIASHPEAAWATSYACLLWQGVDAARPAHDAAISWLLSSKGAITSRVPEGILKQDPTLLGWPWIDETASWVEPTSLALLALGRSEKRNAPRVSAGLALIRDRAIPGGGWNMGNPVVFGTPLRPLPSPTGLAILALAQAGDPIESTVGAATHYLRTRLPETRSPVALGWGLLGLRAWGIVPEDSKLWLAESCEVTLSRPRSVMGLALLLLAADPKGPGAFGLTATRSNDHE